MEGVNWEELEQFRMTVATCLPEALWHKLLEVEEVKERKKKKKGLSTL